MVDIEFWSPSQCTNVFFSNFIYIYIYFLQPNSITLWIGVDMSLDWKPWYNQLTTQINSQRKTYTNS
jgi:hypothetical protein